MKDSNPSAAGNERAAILDAFASRLQESNTGITNIEAVVAATDVSPQAIEQEFGGMDGLVIALVKQLSASMVEPLGECTTEAAFREQLHAFASGVIDPDKLAQLKSLYQIALTDAIRKTGLGQQFYENGPGLLAAELGQFIDRAQAHGIACHEDSRLLASHFMAILRAHLDLSETFTPADESGREQPKVDMARVVQSFCDGAQTRGGR